MKIGIIGAGHIGATAGRLFIQAGHEVALSNSREPETLNELIRELGPQAHAMTVAGAARFGEVILLAVPWRLAEALPAAELVSGKVVIDAMNPYRADGSVFALEGTTSSEETARRLPGARLVKAFNTIWYQHLAGHGDVNKPLEERHAIFLAGDDPEAKRLVSALIAGIGFAPIDTGSLREGGRAQEPHAPLYNRTYTGRPAQQLVKR